MSPMGAYMAWLRSRVGTALVLVPSVNAVVRDADGRILLQRHREGGDWGLPGGAVEPEEDPADALVREVREELDCAITVDGIHEVVFHAYPEFDLYMLVYACTITDGRPRAVEVAEIAWVEPAKLPELDLLPADYPLARKLASASI